MSAFLIRLFLLAALFVGGLLAADTESQFAVINVIRVEKARDNSRLVYFDIEGENGGAVQVQCDPADSSSVFWERLQNELAFIAQKYVPGKEYQFAGVSFPNPVKVVSFAREKRP